jgi:GrpB-like predicted nucleotidyltransferase (UPF0157 family)
MMKIEIAPYNKNWPLEFAKEAKRIKEALGSNCVEIHHIGSTSVPGLPAKPIIDIIPVVKDICSVDQSRLKMEALGYEPKGEFGIAFRRYFQKDNYNVHIFEQGNSEIDRHLKFRDWMRGNPKDRDEYAQLKQSLSIKFPNDLMSYCIGKEEFVTSIDSKTGWSGFKLVMVCTPKEKEAVKYFRKGVMTPEK